MPRGQAQYGWNEAAGRYVDAGGRFVPWPKVKAALEAVIAKSTEEVDRLTKKLVAGQLTVDQWKELVAAELKSMHIAAACVARGGWEQMTPADWGRVGQRLGRQYGWLQNFADQVKSGQQPLDGRAVARAKLYAQATRGTYEAQRRADQQRLGYKLERRVLHGSEHCEDCVRIAALGWSPIGSLPNIGDAACRTNCRCEFRYKK